MLLRRLLKEEEGQTLVEYGLLVALIALVVIAALTILGRKVANTFNAISERLPLTRSGMGGRVDSPMPPSLVCLRPFVPATGIGLRFVCS